MRIKRQKKICLLLSGILLILIPMSGCGEDKQGKGNPYLIRVRDRVFSVKDFIRDFETIRTTYEKSTFKDQTILNDARLRLLDEKIEELLLLERAEDINIDISAETLEREITRIKNGFPEGAFEQVLLEYAVSFNQWKNDLKNRLIMEKVISAELKDRIEISPEDIEAYYKKKIKNTGKAADSPTNDGKLSEDAITFLRQQKKEAVYQEWMKSLRDQYQVEFNKMEWNRICANDAEKK